MDRSQKADAVAQLSEVFGEAGVVVITRNLGLTVDQSTALRGKMREVGASYKVAKNRLAKLALKDTDYEGLDEYLTGPTALVLPVPLMFPLESTRASTFSLSVVTVTEEVT